MQSKRVLTPVLLDPKHRRLLLQWFETLGTFPANNIFGCVR